MARRGNGKSQEGNEREKDLGMKHCNLKWLKSFQCDTETNKSTLEWRGIESECTLATVENMEMQAMLNTTKSGKAEDHITSSPVLRKQEFEPISSNCR